MSNGIPSQISLDDAVVAQDEMGRPFIIVRECDPPVPEVANSRAAKDEKRGTRLVRRSKGGAS